MLGNAAAAEAREFRFVSSSPYPAQHVNPRAADFIEGIAPEHVVAGWRALSDSMIAQPCSSGSGDTVYCTRAWDLASDKCNLQALDASSGKLRWEDRVDGHCLLDEYAWITNPLVDVDGNVYAADSQQVVSFTGDGQLRWRSSVPATLLSRHTPALPNPPFGLNLLPTGELVTATLGDAYVLVMDRATGALLTPPFDLPSEKQKAPGADQQPPGFMSTLAASDVGQVLWNIGLGVSGYENDNNVAVDTHTGLVFITGGAPAPNPNNDGALWAVRYDPHASAGTALAVEFYVEFSGPGGIATTPTVTKDGGFVLIGDNQSNFVAVDIPACRALPAGSACHATAAVPIGAKLGASVTVTPANRVFFPLPQQGLAAYDVARASGAVTLTQVDFLAFPGLTLSTVLTGFDNVIWLGLSQGTRHFLTAVGIDDRKVRSMVEAGDLANVTMAPDGRTLLTNYINFQDELGGQHRPAGVQAWLPAPKRCRARLTSTGEDARPLGACGPPLRRPER